MGAPRSVPAAIAVCLMALALSKLLIFKEAIVSARTLPSECGAFTDDPLTTSTPVKAVHVTELRSCIAALRSGAGLSAPTWTDSSLVTGATQMKATHIIELRAAIHDVFTVYGHTPPAYTDDTLAAGETTIKRAHISEIRSAAIGFDLP